MTHSLVPSTDHRSHTQSHPLVRVDQVRKVLARRRDRDALTVPQLVQSALDTEVSFPVLTVGCENQERRWKGERRRSGQLTRLESGELEKRTSSSSHGSEEVRVNLDDLLDRSGSCTKAKRERESSATRSKHASALTPQLARLLALDAPM